VGCGQQFRIAVRAGGQPDHRRVDGEPFVMDLTLGADDEV
jgi:hypothetical protein